ncbi:hypothetical protein D6D21_02602 [Aureobasidium pullulans]|uniref:Uncharacterized protein n=1 Tax=Aureobasidium pullulans TaxID=5580 RepID=A0AB74J577_AURPU|nr:hypothetical protein D6D21_02602 [Aureobasidium pullulans]THX56614.1 hypothetical protein D6D11_03446 [Aureobasidium pullulans]
MPSLALLINSLSNSEIMSQVQPAQIFNSGSESQSGTGLHLNPAIPDYGSLIVPLRFRHVKHDPTFNTVSEKTPVFQDVLWLPSDHRHLLEKVRKNLYCRLDRTYPKRPRWYCPWRKQRQLDIGLRLFITYQLGKLDIFNENEVNEANWPDILALLRCKRPEEAEFHVDWWFKGEGVTEWTEYFEREKM